MNIDMCIDIASPYTFCSSMAVPKQIRVTIRLTWLIDPGKNNFPGVPRSSHCSRQQSHSLNLREACSSPLSVSNKSIRHSSNKSLRYFYNPLKKGNNFQSERGGHLICITILHFPHALNEKGFKLHAQPQTGAYSC